MPHAANGTIPEHLVDAAERFVKAPGGFSELPNGIKTIITTSIDLSEYNAEADLATATVPLIAAIAEALGLSVGWVIFLGIIVILAALRILEFALVRICNAIPWGFGDGPKAFLTALFHPLDSAENWCITQIVDGTQSLIHLFIRAGELTFQLFFGQAVNSGTAPDNVTIKHIQAEINTLNSRYDTISKEIHQMNQELAVIPLGFTSTGPQPFPTPIAPATGIYPSMGQFNTLTHRVTHILNLLPDVIHDINTIESNQHQFANDLTSLKNQLTGLEANLGSVRAVQVGVQDTLRYVTSTAQRLEFDYGQLAPQVSAHTNQLHSLHPLAQLLFLGQPGLNNLKKLEQNPCQCPAYPGLGGDMAGGLALYEFLTNG